MTAKESSPLFAEDWGWRLRALCRVYGGCEFFRPDDEERGEGRRRHEAAARRVCRACPVRAECAAHSLVAHEEYGIWGGLTEYDRVLLGRVGWRDAWNPRTGRVDMRLIESRLARARAASHRGRPPAVAPGRPAGDQRIVA